MKHFTPQAFADKWRHAVLKERSAYQQHFLDICQLIGHSTPAEVDPRGEFFTFEAFASKNDGRDGYADVWYKDHFAWEYKGKHANLDKAYQQLLQYRENLGNPPLLIVSDIDTIIIRTNFTYMVTQTITLSLEDFQTDRAMSVLEKVFRDPEALRPSVTTEDVTEKAAGHFAKLADILRGSGYENKKIAHFLIRLLFCLFVEDVGLLPPRLFTNLVKSFRNYPKSFSRQLGQLFEAMADGGPFGMDMILHFDGLLFDNAEVLDISPDGIDILIEVSRLDWSNIEPSIFGTLFERSLDPSKRSQLGAHYTSKEDILLIVEPVLMAPLRRKWKEIRKQARELAEKRVAVRSKGKIQSELTELLNNFSNEIASIRVLDPACGSGNFLYIALKQLLSLQKEVITEAQNLGVGILLSVTPEQLHGIEINEYAQQLAQATIWIGYIQWMKENGFGRPVEPILKPLDNILQMDALLSFDERGVPLEAEWPEAEVIIGNPPFLGDKKMRAELGDAYVEHLRACYQTSIPGGADFVTYWFAKTLIYIRKGITNRAGLLSTNSIRTGSNRKVLDDIKQYGDIFLAWSDRPWILDGAAVRVSIVGFDNGEEKNRLLDGKEVSSINSDLTSHVDVTSAHQLLENSNLCYLGMMKAGPFDIDGEHARQMLEAPVNPNGRPNADVIKRRMGGIDVTSRQRDAWIIDFGVDMPLEMAAQFQLPFEYVINNVKPVRDNNRRERTKNRWWIFGEARPGLRKSISGLRRCIVTPEVAKHRVFVWMDTAIIPDHKLHVIARDDDYFFGVLQSRVHEVWSLAQCSWMGVGNDPSYSSSRTFETFPFPFIPGKEPNGHPVVQAIELAARELVEKRDAWLNPPGAREATLKECTLTNLYNVMPTWLQLAHRKLDQAVFAAYGWLDNLSDDEILERLLALNLERSKM